MASPQKENGHIDIANEVAEKLSTLHMSGNEWMIWWVVLRKTWGWKKKEDRISLTQFQKFTGLSRPAVVLALERLVAKNVLVAKPLPLGKEFSFNKDYETWTSSEKATSSIINTKVVAKPLPSIVAKPQHTKETTTKDTITKETIPNGIEGSKINTFIGMFRSINPSFERLYAQKGQREAMSRLISRYGEQKVENMLRELPTILQKPYAPIITTPYQLEQKLGALLIFIKKEGYGQSKVSVYTGK